MMTTDGYGNVRSHLIYLNLFNDTYLNLLLCCLIPVFNQKT